MYPPLVLSYCSVEIIRRSYASIEKIIVRGNIKGQMINYKYVISEFMAQSIQIFIFLVMHLENNPKSKKCIVYMNEQCYNFKITE